MSGQPHRPVLITGGAGFIGTNLADRLARDGESVLIFDNLSRPGVEANLAWLQRVHGDRVTAETADIRDHQALARAASRASAIYHFAAQVAVTTSVVRPMEDFAVNAGGTLNLLEVLRSLPAPPPLIFTSTNKVYGKLAGIPLTAGESRYLPADAALRETGISERQPLDFYSPYGCSKGTADQYVIDYARIYGVPTVVFRMSCIYGPHQCGTEDQGWVAHFLIRSLQQEAITIYGDGRQVRDILFVDDLVEALLLARRRIETVRGQAFNIGGGPANAISLRELLALITDLNRRPPEIRFGTGRPGDQAYYVSNVGRFCQQTGWQPRVGVRDGVARLHAWLRERSLSAAGRQMAAVP